MNTIHTLSLKTWLPASLIAFSLITIVSTTWINGKFSKDHYIESVKDYVLFEVETLSHGLENQLINGNPEGIEDILNERSRNSKYHALLVVRRPELTVWATAWSRKASASVFDLNAIDRQIIRTMAKAVTAQVVYDDNNKWVYAYHPVPTRVVNTKPVQDGVLIARYDVSAELDELNESLLLNSIFFSLLFLLLIAVLQTFYQRYIQAPVNHLIQLVRRFTLLPEEIAPDLTGHSEFTALGDALRSMSTSILRASAEKKAAQMEARQGAEILDSVFKTLPDLFFLVDRNMRIVDYHASHDQALYTSPELFLGKTLAEVLPTDVAKQALDGVSSVRQNGDMITFDYDMPVNESDDNLAHFEARLVQVPNSDKVMIIVRDITERWESEMLIERQAFYDSLTDLPNRYLALDRLNQFILDAKRNAHQIAVMFVDLDDFKKINDTLGHAMGDQVLIETAQRLRNEIRDVDTIARLGGDEFIILLNNVHKTESLHGVVEKIMHVLSLPYQNEGRELVISASMGVAIYPEDSLNASDLLRNADIAMYHAKALGKAQYSFFTEQMNEQLTRRLVLEQHMSTALANGEFEVHYQPQFDLTNQKLIGAEALLRWKNPKIGSISPTEFIPIAEQNGYIIAIGYFVIEKVIAQCVQWRDRLDDDFRIAINLSPRQMRDHSILQFVDKQMQKHRIDGRHLEFEITEGVLLSAHASVKSILNGFHKLDIALSMDDFGTGYSSLSYLLEYPFDMVKIDRSFIKNIAQSDQSRNLVSAIIGMAHNLRLTVLAEGVERASQADLLRSYGCDYIQGYLMGKALPADAFVTRWSQAQWPTRLLET